jgi:quercetin dioxygenase-like cupin family protein
MKGHPMAIPHAFPGMPVNLRSAEESLSEARTTALVKNNTFEAIRLVLPQGSEVCHNHQVEGAITVQCLQGRAALTVGDSTHDLRAGHWLYLLANDPHTLRGIEDSLVLLTIIFPQRP